ncbi:MAG: bifunctional diaminohydroxyphosphoribosylaminopyrimidine deaminase/5-amino-6-(5-phosphoribosylamino)uracil reductase RibD [Chitinophagales bacterium]|nr:bifunctional diaminohydroxyphosphoribosylaminopyrimidine deaminase/5-amino-6-(5-phosphoribosylamino)uracil reductase RibD [Chitinophagales bacterium]
MTTDQAADTVYMQRALDLAAGGFGTTRSNPMVGAVIVYNDRIIGEGYHERFGGPHAEINALNQVADADRPFLPQSTMYVTLEPCSHEGKTPPCANRIVKEKIKRVVIGTMDPNPIVAGKGANYLRENGVFVDTSVMESACKALLDKFNANLQGIPYVQLKWAQSKDGKLGIEGKQVWLSNPYSRVLVHRYRSIYDGILIGKYTAMIDNPTMDARFWNHKKPIRIILDTNLEIPKSNRLYNRSAMTWIVNSHINKDENNLHFILADSRNVEGLLKTLFSKGITSLIVEGGAQVLSAFVHSGYWHEAMVIKTPNALGSGISAPIVQGRLLSFADVFGDKIDFIKNGNFRHENQR